MEFTVQEKYNISKVYDEVAKNIFEKVRLIEHEE